MFEKRPRCSGVRNKNLTLLSFASTMFQDLTIRAQTTDRVGNIVESYFSSVQLQTEYLPYLRGLYYCSCRRDFGAYFFLRFNSRRHAYLPTGIVREQNTKSGHCSPTALNTGCGSIASSMSTAANPCLLLACLSMLRTMHWCWNVLFSQLLLRPCFRKRVVFFFTIKKKMCFTTIDSPVW